MKKFLAMAVLVLAAAACTNESDNEVMNSEAVAAKPEPTEVTLTFSPYEMQAMTRAATSIAGVVNRLDVWIVDGSDVTAISQTAEDAGFGTVTATLDKTKTYTLYAVAHKATGAATLTDGIISWPNDKVTHTMYYTTTFSPSTATALNCEMTRIVAMFRMETTDAVPDECQTMRFAIPGTGTRWSVTTGMNNVTDRTVEFTGFIRRADNTAQFTMYAIVIDAQTLHDITVTALDGDGNTMQERVFKDVPLRNGYRTAYRGLFFKDEEMSMAFTVGDWAEYDVVEF